MGFERIGGHTAWEGRIARVRVDRFRYEDGSEAEREIVEHPGSVAVVAHDGERVYMVRQPREAVGEQALLELPAGKLDEEGEEPLDTARRELAEEVGMGASTWEPLTAVFLSPGFSDERCHLFLATGLYEESATADEEERIEIEAVPLAELDRLIDECLDAKSVLGLLLLRARLRPS